MGYLVHVHNKNQVRILRVIISDWIPGFGHHSCKKYPYSFFFFLVEAIWDKFTDQKHNETPRQLRKPWQFTAKIGDIL